MSVIQLLYECNNYPWGKKGSESLAARYAASTPGSKFTPDENEYYSEAWMGTYPTLPSKVLITGEDLQQHLNAHKEELVGKPILDKFGADLPYLPKILSIAKALPLQIHPDKEVAARLHKQNPEKFTDSNHKPEIAVALSKFEAFVGFLPLSEIQQLFSEVPAVKSRFNITRETQFTEATLKKLLEKILDLPDEDIKKIYGELLTTHLNAFGEHKYISELLPRLASQYDKSDPGILIALLTMNFLTLNKGEAIFIPADGIHAYLSGDIVECMARSDNVLNTGFCPRADRDAAEFMAALIFKPKSTDEAILRSKKSEKGLKGHTKVFAPPMSEFDLLVTELKDNETEKIKAIQGPSILVVTAGQGKLRAEKKEYNLKEGYVFFVGYNTEVELIAEGKLETHMPFCEA